MCLCWMVCPPSEALSPILSLILSPRLSSFLCPFVGWCVCLTPRLPLCSFCWMVCFFRSLVPFVSQLVAQLVSQLLSPLVSHLSLLVSLCWMVCLPSQGLLSLVSSLSPILSASVFLRPCRPCFPACHPACLSASLSACLPPLPSCFPLLDGVSAFLRPCLPCLQFVFHLVSPLPPSLSSFLFSFVGWCVRLPKALSPLFPSLSPSLSLFLFSVVVNGLILHVCWCLGNIECTLLAWSCSPAWKPWARGLRMIMMSFFSFILRCFHYRMG